MKQRVKLARNETILDFYYFINQVQEKTPGKTICKIKDFSIFYMIRILHPLEQKELSFSQLYRDSGISYKTAYIRYLKILSDFKFIEKQVIHKYSVLYHITEKGKILLDLFRQ